MVKFLGRFRSASCQGDPPLPPGHYHHLPITSNASVIPAQPPPNTQPPVRLAKRTRCRKLPLLWKMTVALVQCYTTCQPNFRYDPRCNPRRVLTNPSVPTDNGGHDNAQADLIIAVQDILQSENESPIRRFRVVDLVGHGTYGQVVKCEDLCKGGIVAIKVIKNKPAYYNQAFMEIRLLKLLNEQCDPMDEYHIVRLKDNFMYKNHLCLAFEILNLSLYDTIKRANHSGQAVNRIRSVCGQLLRALQLLRDYRIIHCDLKPENILLTSADPDAPIKVIDFGSACFDYQTVYSYIQSRFYRAPEILLQIPYHAAIDVWSLGCIAAELYIGLPLFPGVDEPDQIRRIVLLCGPPSLAMLQRGAASAKFFNESTGELHDYILNSGMAAAAPRSIREALAARQDDPDHECFLDFLRGLLPLTPEQRWTPAQASAHPFITGAAFTGPFHPPDNLGRTTAAKIIPRPTPPQYSYSGHRLGGGQVGSACGEPHPRMMQLAFQRMSIQAAAAAAAGPYVRLQPAPHSKPRRSSTTNIMPPSYPVPVPVPVPYSPMLSAGDDWYHRQPGMSPLVASPNVAPEWDPYWGMPESMLPPPMSPVAPVVPRQRRSSMPVNPYLEQYGVGGGGGGGTLGPPPGSAHLLQRRHQWY